MFKVYSRNVKKLNEKQWALLNSDLYKPALRNGLCVYNFRNILSFSCETRRFMINVEKGRIHSEKAQVRSFNICLEKSSMTRLKSRN